MALLVLIWSSGPWFPKLMDTLLQQPWPAILAAFLIGTSKAGLKGLSVLNVTLMALSYGAFSSTGLIMPLLVVGDIFAVWYYNRHTEWKPLLRILPIMLVGIGLGTWIGDALPERVFQYTLAGIVLLSLGLLLYRDLRPEQLQKIPPFFAPIMGLLAGLATMLGNLAGSFTNLYFIGLGLEKNTFVGTAAWLFLITNAIKLPLHYWVWGTIDANSLQVDLQLLPFLLVGLVVGVRIVRYIPEKAYRRFILAVTALGALLMLAG